MPRAKTVRLSMSCRASILRAARYSQPCKHPSAAELQHDFLWRTTLDLPERGRIGIFNRSYYEEVLIARVHPQILRGEGLPGKLHEKTIWHDRYRSILNLERHLDRNGTRIIKFFLHLSKEEQRKRFIDRIDRPEKNWKFSPRGRVEERGFWNAYMQAYEKALERYQHQARPVVRGFRPDDQRNTRLIVSRIVARIRFDALEIELTQNKVPRAAATARAAQNS